MTCKYCKADCALRGEQQEKECKGYIPMANGDYTRVMTNDELAELLREVYNAGVDDATAWDWGNTQNTFIWDAEWFKQPVK